MLTYQEPIQKSVRLVPQPPFEPVTIREAKKRIELAADFADHDGDIEEMIRAARDQVEHDTGIICATGTFTKKLSLWPADGWLELDVRPVTSITSIVYNDSAGASQTWVSSSYSLSTSTVTPAIFLAYNTSGPSSRGYYHDITITFVAGYLTQATVNPQVKKAVLLDIARQFADREGMEKGDFTRAYEMTIRRLQRSTYP